MDGHWREQFTAFKKRFCVLNVFKFVVVMIVLIRGFKQCGLFQTHFILEKVGGGRVFLFCKVLFYGVDGLKWGLIKRYTIDFRGGYGIEYVIMGTK